MKAIIFDCDGVLINSELIYKSSERLFLESVGLTYEPAEFFRRFMGRSEESFFEEVENDHRALHGIPLPENFREDLIAHQRARFATELTAVKGMNDLIKKFKRIPTAVASSSPSKSLAYKLGITGLKDLFGERIFSADQVRFGKPEPDLFLFAADQIGMTPADCIVIEDSENGVLAGLAAGMTVYGFTGGGHCHESHDDTLLAAGAKKVARDAIILQSLLLEIFKPAPDEQLSSV